MRRSAAIEWGMEVQAYAAETARDADFAVDAIFSGNRMRAVDRLNRISARSERIATEARDWTAAAEAAR